MLRNSASKIPDHRGAIRLGRLIILALMMGAFIWVLLTAVRLFEQFSAEDSSISQISAPVKPSLDLTGFEAGNLISDSKFFDASTMTLEEISNFISEKNAGCVPGDQPCLANYRETTADIPPSVRCDGYQGQSQETAAQIIYKTAQSCHINPQVLLVTMQKEQGLLTASDQQLNDTRYAWAMGFACPDNQSCDQQYAGFATQVYFSAAQFRRYKQNPSEFSVRAGVTNTIRYSPDPDCGAGKVKIVNQATAGLYNYTPYQPNQDALYGHTSACASWGNLNFYGLFRAWFGNPKEP